MSKMMNVKKLVLWLVAIMLCSFALAAAAQFISGGADAFTKPGFIIQGKHTIDIDETKTLDMEGLENLDIFSTSTDINIISTNDSTIKAHLYGQISCSNKNYFPTLEAKQSGRNGEIRITWPEVITVGYLNSNVNMDLYLPKAYQQNLSLKVSSAEILFEELTLKNFYCTSTSGDLTGKLAITENTVFNTSSGIYEVNVQAQNSFTMESTSGDLKSTRVEAENFSRKSSSGFTKIDTLNCTDFSFESTSGDLTVKAIQATNSKVDTSSGILNLAGESVQKAELSSTSGDITWKDLNAKETTISTSSGATVLTGLMGSLKLESSSGDADIQFSTLKGKAILKASSGQMKLRLPETAEFELDCTTNSGVINVNDFKLLVQGEVSEDQLSGTVGSNQNRVKIETSSGDIILLKN